jgi:hypothetical protein
MIEFLWLKEVAGSYVHPDIHMGITFKWLHEVSGVMW